MQRNEYFRACLCRMEYCPKSLRTQRYWIEDCRWKYPASEQCRLRALINRTNLRLLMYMNLLWKELCER